MIIILFGGMSDERHVSVASAQNIIRRFDGALAWFWTSQGAVHDVSSLDLVAHQQPFQNDFVPVRPAIFPTLEQALDTLPVEDPLFFLALHGGEGEDGTVQRMLEQRGIPFTGSGSAASAAAFDKGRAKEIVRDVVPVAESRIARDESQLREAVRDLHSRHERLVLKPLAAGSSRGLFFLGREDDVEDVVQRVLALRIPYIVEQYLAGRELTVGVTDHDGATIALPVIEIQVDAGHSFDYEGKYLGKGTHEICPAPIPDDLAEKAKLTALRAHQALGCEGYSRSDLIATADGNVYFLELNTLPGLTTSSLVPQELAAAGITFEKFLDEQAQLALERSKRVAPPEAHRSLRF